MSERPVTGSNATEPPPHTPWARLYLIFRIVEVRLRFVIILVATGLAIGYWDSIENRWERLVTPSAPEASADPAATELFCPMHLQVIRPFSARAQGCPVCGMPLSARPKSDPSRPGGGTAGRVQLSPDRITLAGVTTESVTRRALTRRISGVGSIRLDETLVSMVVSRTRGFLERLYVDSTYQTVTSGQPLAEIYSPDILVAFQELLNAVNNPGTPTLVAALQVKLELLGVATEEIDGIIRSGMPNTRVIIRCPRKGTVVRKFVVQGSYLESGAPLIEIADLSRVWAEADVYERDLSFLRQGQTAEVMVDALPGRRYTGTVALVAPRVDPETRTVSVRIVLANESQELRPGMAATVEIAAPPATPHPGDTKRRSWWCPAHPDVASERDGETCKRCGGMKLVPRDVAWDALPPVSVPESAVIDTGARQIVYIEVGPGIFEGRAVELGPRVGEFYPVREGLAEGDRVVTRGAFLVDAESRLNPSASPILVGSGAVSR